MLNLNFLFFFFEVWPSFLYPLFLNIFNPMILTYFLLKNVIMNLIIILNIIIEASLFILIYLFIYFSADFIINFFGVL